MKRPVIKAQWKKLLFFNYKVDPALLDPYKPSFTEYALWENECYVSLVGFQFQDVSIGGIHIPLHTNFDEINLRFYVRRQFEDTWRYGVVFLKEIVALPLVTLTANGIFDEQYETLPVKHAFNLLPERLDISYSWKKKNWNYMSIETGSVRSPMPVGGHAEFFTKQHWGYNRLKDDKTIEYFVEHPSWDIYPTIHYSIQVDFENTFGKEFAFLTHHPAHSVFLAEGSDIIMSKEMIIRSQI